MKKIQIILFAIAILISCPSWAMKLTSKIRSFELKQNASKIWVSKGCKNCEAETIFQKLTKPEALKALEQDQRGQVPIGTRLCSGLGGLVWVLMDEKKTQYSVCEFNDQSATLTSDLSSLAHRLIE